MMKLSHMLKVVETLDEAWQSPLAEEIFSRWGFDQAHVEYIRASSNFVFLVQQEEERFILRFIQADERSLEQLEVEAELLIALKQQGANVNTPIKSQQGLLVERVETAQGVYYASLFSYIEGEHLEFEDLQDEDFYRWGAALGELHQQLKRLPEQLKVKRQSWRDLLLKLQQTLPQAETAIHNELTQVLAHGDQLPMTAQTYGVIHYDFELDNMMWQEQHTGIIDFDDSLQHWYIADIAYALRDLFEDGIDLTHPSFRQFIKGYQSHTELEESHLEQLDWCMGIHQLIRFARITAAIDVDAHADHPEWFRGLREKLIAISDNYRASLLKA